jgi:hypothetical protein
MWRSCKSLGQRGSYEAVGRRVSAVTDRHATMTQRRRPRQFGDRVKLTRSTCLRILSSVFLGIEAEAGMAMGVERMDDFFGIEVDG